MRRLLLYAAVSVVSTFVYMFVWFLGIQYGLTVLPEAPAWFLGHSQEGQRRFAWMEIQSGVGVLVATCLFALLLIYVLKAHAVKVACAVCVLTALFMMGPLATGSINPGAPSETVALQEQSRRIAFAKTLFLPVIVFILWRVRRAPSTRPNAV